MPAEVEDLEHASRLAAKVAWGDVPAVAVGEDIVSMVRARASSDAALLAAVRSFSARAEHRADGHVSVAAWLFTKADTANIASAKVQGATCTIALIFPTSIVLFAETKVTPAPRMSVTVTFVAGEGPLFRATMV